MGLILGHGNSTTFTRKPTDTPPGNPYQRIRDVWFAYVNSPLFCRAQKNRITKMHNGQTTSYLYTPSTPPPPPGNSLTPMYYYWPSKKGKYYPTTNIISTSKFRYRVEVKATILPDSHPRSMIPDHLRIDIHDGEKENHTSRSLRSRSSFRARMSSSSRRRSASWATIPPGAGPQPPFRATMGMFVWEGQGVRGEGTPLSEGGEETLSAPTPCRNPLP